LALTPGTRLGVYEVTMPIGAGGMGEVYRATDSNLKRSVAIKVLPASVAGDADRLARFQREAEVLAALNHPNIAAIYGLEKTVDFTALVMELVEGEDLSQRIARGAIPIDEALPIAKQIADALKAAHEQAIIHRDLKPANIKVRPDGTVKVLDFGLAKAVEPAGTKSSSVSMSPTITSPAMMTGAGMILGTAAYMSPEQAKGRVVDRRADIWAFGAVLFEMLTATRAFGGEDVTDTIVSVISKEPDWAALPAATPLPVRLLLRRCLDKDSRRRLRDIGEARFALETAYDSAAAPVNELRHRRSPLVWAVAVIAVVSLALAAFAMWRRPLGVQPSMTFAIELPEGQTFTRAGRRVIALSPDGTRLVYVANRQLYLRNLNELTATPIAGTAASDPSEPLISPDGQWVAFWSAESLKKIPIDGGTAVTLASVNNPYGASWDGDRLLLGQETPRGIVEVPASGGPAKLIVALDESKDELAEGPELVAGGRAMLFTLRTRQQAWDNASIVVQDLTSGRRTTVVQGGTAGHLLPTGHLVYARGTTLYAVTVDERSLRVTGNPVPLEQDVRLADGGFSGAAQVVWSTAGTLAYVPTNAAHLLNRSLAWIDRSGRVEPVAALPARRYQAASAQMRVSPDGGRVAVTILADSISSTDTLRGQDIWIWAIARGTLTRQTFTSRSASPVWSPDGTRLCNASELELVCQAADGTGQRQPMFDVAGPFSFSEIGPMSPDGRNMLLVARANNKADQSIGLAPMGTRLEPRPLVHSSGSGSGPAISPDGRWLAYVSEETGVGEVYVRPFPDVDSGRWQISSGGGLDPQWSPKGGELFYLDVSGSAGSSPAKALMAVDYRATPGFSVGKPTALFKFPAAAGRGFAVGPDGRFLLNLPAASPDETVAREQIVVAQNWFEKLRQRVPAK
jgi:serine/threonine protein kinase/Tol biopolymer transport system component